MDTVYYTLKTRKVKVSGGADLLTFVPSPAPAPAAQGSGEVLDFARCRQRLETKAAWKGLTQAAEVADEVPGEDAAEEMVYVPRPRERRAERAALWMELAASAAVILVSLAAGVACLGMF